jgi:hypothetical protein
MDLYIHKSPSNKIKKGKSRTYHRPKDKFSICRCRGVTGARRVVAGVTSVGGDDAEADVSMRLVAGAPNLNRGGAGEANIWLYPDE